MSASIFDVDVCASVEPPSLCELADQQCVLQQRGARRARRDDIYRAFYAVNVVHGLTPHDFAAFRMAWIATYRWAAFEPMSDPEAFFNKQVTCGCRECAAKHAA
jgi:hypothetical protein